MGKRIKDISIAEQVGFVDTLRVLVDKLDADEGLPWLQAKSMQLKYLGNAYFAGSDNNDNFHPNIIESDSYIRFSTDGGNYWIDLSTKNVREDINLYFTSQRVIDTHSSINHAGLTGILALGTTAGTALEGNTVIPSIVYSPISIPALRASSTIFLDINFISVTYESTIFFV